MADVGTLNIRIETKGAKEAARDLDGLVTSGERAETKLGGLEKQAGRLSGAGGLGKLAAQTAASAAALAGIGAAAATASALIGKALDTYGRHQHELSMVSTMLDRHAMGQEAYTRQLEEYGRGMRALSVEMGESTQSLSKGLYDILSASVAPSQALDVLAVSAKAAQGGFTDTATAADLITSSLNAYGLQADQAGKVSDIAFATVARGKLTFSELAANIGKVAPTSAQAGASLEQVGAMLATVTRQGIKAEQATTDLNSLFVQFARATDKQTQAWAELTQGTELAGTQFGTTLLVGDRLFQTLGILSRATEKQRVEIAGETTALQGVNAMIKDTEGLHKDLARTTNSAGEATEAFNKTLDDQERAERRVAAAAEAAWAAMGKMISGPATQGMNKIADIMERIAKAADPKGKPGSSLADELFKETINWTENGLKLRIQYLEDELEKSFEKLQKSPWSSDLLKNSIPTLIWKSNIKDQLAEIREWEKKLEELQKKNKVEVTVEAKVETKMASGSMFGVDLFTPERLGLDTLAKAGQPIIEAQAAAQRTLLQAAEDSLPKRLQLIDLEAAAQTRAMQAKIAEGKATEANLTAIQIEADAKRQAARIEWGRKGAEDRRKVESEVLEAVEALGQSGEERQIARLQRELEAYRAQGQAKAEVVEGYETLIAARQEEIQREAATRQLKVWEENARLTADKLNLRADLERDISDQVKELTLDELSFKLEMEKKWLEEKLKLNETASAGLEEEIRKLYKLRIGKILDEHADKHGSVADKVMRSWADTDENIARTTENALRSVQDMFTDTWLGLIKGEIDSFDDFLDSALDNALNIFANWLSQMGTLWLTSNIASLFGQGEGMSLGDALGSLLGKAGAAAASNSGSGAGKEAAGNAAGAAAKEGGLSGAGITTGIGAAAGAAAGGYAGSKLGESVGGDTGGMIGGLAGTIAGGYLGKLAAGYLAEYLGLTAAAQTATASLAGGGVLTASGTLGTSAVTGLSGSATLVGSGAAAGAGTAAGAGAAGAGAAGSSAAGASAAGMGAAGALTATGIGAILAAIMVAGNTIMLGDPDTPQDARRRLETTIEDLKRQGGFGAGDEWSFNGYTNQRAAMLMGDAGFSGTGMDELKSMLAEAGVAWDEFEDRVADFDLSAAFKKDARQLGGGTNSAAGLERAARELAEAWGISLEDALDEVWGHSNLNLDPFATNTEPYEKARLAIEQTSDGLSALSMNVPGINDVTNAVLDLGNGMALTEVPLNNFAMGTENSIQSMWGAAEASGALTGALEGTANAAFQATEIGNGLYSLTMQLGETSLETTASLDVFKEGVGFAAEAMESAGDAAFSLGELIGGLPTEHTINVTTRYTTVGTPTETPLGGDGENAGDIPAFHRGGAVLASLASLPAYHSGGEVLARLLPGEDVWSREDIARHGGLGAVEAMRKGGRTAPARGGDTSVHYTFNIQTKPGQDDKAIARDLMRRVKLAEAQPGGRVRPVRQTGQL